MLFIYCTFHMLFIYFICHIHFVSLTLYFLYLYTCHILSSHSSVMLLISYHIFCTCHFILGFMSANTLEVDTGNNYMYPKVLSLYETMISICMYPKVLSLYETVISICLYPKVSSLYEKVTYAMCYMVTLSGPP